MIVHQKRSSTGDVGYKLKQRGYELDVKRPVFGEALPDNMDNHDLAVIYGGPPSANDNDDYIKYDGEQGSKNNGVWRQEGKDYIVKDGDVIFFRFNV